jgi:hypothetical protein
MKSQRTSKLVAILLATASTLGTSHAVLTFTSTPVATGGEAYYSDGGVDTGADYFGIVDNTKTMIAGDPFSASDTAPPIGALAGRDLDDGNSRPKTRTAEWQLNIASIPNAVSPFTNISFSGRIAAADDSPWDNDPGGPNVDFITFELIQDGVTLTSETKDFRSTAAIGFVNGNLALDTDGNGVGDGTVVPNAFTDPVLAQAFSLTGTGANSTIILRVTAHSDSGNEEFWIDGTLSADVDVIPEPSSSLMLALAGGLLAIRRKK